MRDKEIAMLRKAAEGVTFALVSSAVVMILVLFFGGYV
jgi:hypothetical protein